MLLKTNEKKTQRIIETTVTEIWQKEAKSTAMFYISFETDHFVSVFVASFGFALNPVSFGSGYPFDKEIFLFASCKIMQDH